MSVVPLARYLVDFGTGEEAGKSDSDVARGKVELEQARALAAKDMEAKVAESYARGVQDGRAAAEADSAMRLQAEREAFQRELASARQAWAANEGEALAERLAAGLRQIEQGTADTVARILAQVTSATVQRAAVAELLAALEGVLAKAAGARVEIAGPEDLLAAIRARLEARSIAAVYTVSTGPDIRVTVDKTLLETRIGAWSTRLAEAIA
jgi:hypothetical protein